jgi:hypothetical protein
MFTLYPGISDAECIDYLTLCRECGVRSITVDQRTFNTFVRLKNSEYRFRSSKNTADVDESTAGKANLFFVRRNRGAQTNSAGTRSEKG